MFGHTGLGMLMGADESRCKANISERIIALSNDAVTAGFLNMATRHECLVLPYWPLSSGVELLEMPFGKPVNGW